jgi:hypothetical protein
VTAIIIAGVFLAAVVAAALSAPYVYSELMGHTPTSVALFDAANRRLFIGDFIYPTTGCGIDGCQGWSGESDRLLSAGIPCE